MKLWGVNFGIERMSEARRANLQNDVTGKLEAGVGACREACRKVLDSGINKVGGLSSVVLLCVCEKTIAGCLLR